MGEITTIGLHLAKLVFQAHGANRSGSVVFRKTLRRHKVLAFFAAQPPCLVAMEACGEAVRRRQERSGSSERDDLSHARSSGAAADPEHQRASWPSG